MAIYLNAMGPFITSDLSEIALEHTYGQINTVPEIRGRMYDAVVFDDLQQEEQQEMAIRHTPPRRNNNLPPFEQLQQSRRDRNIDNRIYVDMGAHSHTQPRTVTWNGDAQWNEIVNITTTASTSATTGGLGNITYTFSNFGQSDTFTFTGQDFSAAAAAQESIQETRRRYEERRIAEDKKRAGAALWRNIYSKWAWDNASAGQHQLNTHVKYFKYQHRSIERELLEAIANKRIFKTKTTFFNPQTYEVFLFEEKIAVIDPETYRVTAVTCPKNVSNIKLFRHRLRQLGVRCINKNHQNRLYQDKDSYVVITPGQTVVLPYYSNLICLPKALSGHFDLPAQLEFPFEVKWHELKELRCFIRTHLFTVRIQMGESGVIVRSRIAIRASTRIDNLPYLLDDTCVMTYREFNNGKLAEVTRLLKVSMVEALHKYEMKQARETIMHHRNTENWN